MVAPGQGPDTILGQLRTRIDSAFLPRPLHIVNALPRNSLGKLARSEILALLEKSPAASAPMTLQIASDHPAGPGHFPGNPIVPGAVLLDTLMATMYPNGWSGELQSAKFHHPVRPGDRLTVVQTIDGNTVRFECRLDGSDKLVLSGALRLTSLPQ